MEEFKITDAKEVTTFVNFFYKLNQTFKTCISSKTHKLCSKYTLYKGKIYSFNRDAIVNIISEPVYAKKELFFKEHFEQLCIYVTGLDFYTFCQDNKKHINEVVMNDNGLLFKTSLPEVELLIPVIDKSNDIEFYKTLCKDGVLSYMKSENEHTRAKLNADVIENILSTDSPTVVNVNDIKFRVTSKTLFGLNSKTKTKTVKKEKVTETITSDTDIVIYKTDRENIYGVKVIIDNSEMTTPLKIVNCFAIINY